MLRVLQIENHLDTTPCYFSWVKLYMISEMAGSETMSPMSGQMVLTGRVDV